MEIKHENFWEFVDTPNYYQSVMLNMGSPKAGATVRFGLLSKGRHPNYEVHHANGKREAFRGNGHKPNLHDPLYEIEHLSPHSYDYDQVKTLLKNQFDRKEKKA